MRFPKNIDYSVYEQIIKDVVFDHTDTDGISQFHISDISHSAYFNREYAEEFKKWLKSNHIVDSFFDTGNSNFFKCKVTTTFYQEQLNRKAFDDSKRSTK